MSNDLETRPLDECLKPEIEMARKPRNYRLLCARSLLACTMCALRIYGRIESVHRKTQCHKLKYKNPLASKWKK